MSTWIKPGNAANWEEAFPNMAESDSRDLNSALMLLAAWISRGHATIPVKNKTRVWVLEAILSSCISTNSYAVDSCDSMESLGRLVYWLIKALDTGPVVGRGY